MDIDLEGLKRIANELVSKAEQIKGVANDPEARRRIKLHEPKGVAGNPAIDSPRLEELFNATRELWKVASAVQNGETDSVQNGPRPYMSSDLQTCIENVRTRLKGL